MNQALFRCPHCAFVHRFSTFPFHLVNVGGPPYLKCFEEDGGCGRMCIITAIEGECHTKEIHAKPMFKPAPAVQSGLF